MTACSVISEVASLEVCFQSYAGYDDDYDWDDTSGSSGYYQSDEEVTEFFTTFSLVFGLWVDVISAVVLSAIYRTPLDIKSVHKIPVVDRRNRGANFIIYFLAPFAWSMLSLASGVISIEYGDFVPCGSDNDGDNVEIYLLLSGLLLVFVGAVLFFLSGFMFFLACDAPVTAMEGCCRYVREKSRSIVLSKGPFLDGWWQVQGAIWSFRTGAFSTEVTILVAVVSVVGQILAAKGSFAPPEFVVESAGPVRRTWSRAEPDRPQVV